MNRLGDPGRAFSYGADTEKKSGKVQYLTKPPSDPPPPALFIIFSEKNLPWFSLKIASTYNGQNENHTWSQFSVW